MQTLPAQYFDEYANPKMHSIERTVRQFVLINP